MRSKAEKSKSVEKKKTAKKRKNPFRFFVYDFVKVTGALFGLAYVRPKRLYESKEAKRKIKGRAVVVSNHIGALDPIAIHFAFPYRRLHFLALQEVFESKAGNWFFTRVNCIPVDRQNFNMNTFKRSVEVLDDGGILCIFPEGAINAQKDTVNSFKSGAVLMAVRGGAPIVPVYIAPRAKWYNRTVLVLGEPIDIEAHGGGRTLDSVNAVTAALYDKEIKLMEIYNKWKNRKSST